LPPLLSFSSLLKIMIALEEWSTGTFTPFDSLILIAKTIDLRTQELSAQILAFKEVRPAAWTAFCHQVHLAAASHRLDSLALPQLTYLADTIKTYKPELENTNDGEDDDESMDERMSDMEE
jgi:hypothetical protein